MSGVPGLPFRVFVLVVVCSLGGWFFATGFSMLWFFRLHIGLAGLAFEPLLAVPWGFVSGLAVGSSLAKAWAGFISASALWTQPVKLSALCCLLFFCISWTLLSARRCLSSRWSAS